MALEREIDGGYVWKQRIWWGKSANLGLKGEPIGTGHMANSYSSLGHCWKLFHVNYLSSLPSPSLSLIRSRYHISLSPTVSPKNPTSCHHCAQPLSPSSFWASRSPPKLVITLVTRDLDRSQVRASFVNHWGSWAHPSTVVHFWLWYMYNRAPQLKASQPAQESARSVIIARRIEGHQF